MRPWYKYILNYENTMRFLPKDETYSLQEKTIGYDLDDGYKSKEDFFKTHFYNGHPRLKHYHDYLKQNLKKGHEILSIGSGRCVNELLLIEDGFNIICSDLEQPCREKTLSLFPNLKFVKYDIISSSFEYKVDCIISLSIFYLFDENELLMIFKNIAKNLKPGGRFIFDPGGAVDSFVTYLNDEIIYKFETNFIWMIQKLRRRKCAVIKKHQGYRSKNDEITSVAKKAGFALSKIECFDYSTEIKKRSILLGKFPDKIINTIGRFIPYVRMFTFVKNQ